MSNYRIPSDYKNQTPRAIHRRASSAYGTIHPGLAIPVHHRHLNVGERIRGRIDELLQSQPMLGPLMNGFKLITIATFTPDSAIYGWMSNGRRFSADEWVKFGKAYFNLAGSNLNNYKDPAFKIDRLVRRLTFGLDLNADTKKIYESWVSDKLNVTGSSGQPTHIGRGGLWDWLGVAAGAVCPNLGRKQQGDTGVRGEIYPPSFKFNAAPFFAYFLSHYYYIANMQEDYMYFTRGVGEMQKTRPDGQQESLYRPFFSDVFTSLDPNAFLYSLDDVRNSTRKGAGCELFELFSKALPTSNSLMAMACAGIQGYGGLLSVPYSPDLFGNIIKQGSSPSVEIEVMNSVDSNSDTGFSVAVPELRLKTKIQNWMDRLFISGGRVGDVFRTLWGTKSSAPYVNKPDFLGVWQASINPSNVRAMANGSASGEDANLGQLAACVDRYCDFTGYSGIDYYAKEPGTFMLITMLVPEPAYSQGLHPDLSSISFGDDFNPELNGIGFQLVPRHRFSMMPRGLNLTGLDGDANPWLGYSGTGVTIDPNTRSVGQEVAWSWLRTDYSRLHGDFAQNGNYQYWVLARRFTTYFPDDGTGLYTDAEYTGSYINPLDWQYLFVDQTLMAGNFAYYGTFDLKVTSSLSANYMPYLGR
uniref:Major capsid protein n=1 Tax=Microviridae sp. ctNWS1 TaxID=2826733 RepID=A0A8S5N4I4_9VIRU|nr:MAG TPA: Major capsid protein [Microviridae sp. ctNWS1]